MPRVVAGRYKGSRLAAPAGDRTRPTTDKVKEALFSIIQTRVYDSSFLDLYSGSGQIAIEALSRGAGCAVMVEKDAKAAGIIRGNLDKIRASEDEATLLRLPVDKAVTKLAKDGMKFDIIFLDPPYMSAQKALTEALDLISSGDVLAEDGIVILEHSSDRHQAAMIPTEYEEFESFRSCSYGLSMLTFFKRGRATVP